MCNGISGSMVQRCLCWPRSCSKVGDNHLPKQLLFGEHLTFVTDPSYIGQMLLLYRNGVQVGSS